METQVVERDPRLDRLWELLPAIHRRRDAETHGALRALLELVAEQALGIEDDIGQRYEDWFIETCADWVVPYIGALVGVVTPPGGDPPSRRSVANAIRNRRRKGTLALLEDLAGEIGGWPARAMETGPGAAQSQSLRLPQGERGRFYDLRARGVAAPGSRADVALSVWRLRSFAVTRAPAACLEDIGPHVFAFSLLGNDVPLFAPGAEGAPPQRITRAMLASPERDPRGFATASPDLWGSALTVWAAGWPNARAAGSAPIPADKVIVADLSDWNYLPPRDHVAIDPERGRLVFPPRQFARKQVSVQYSYGFSAAIGGGEYHRPIAQPEGVEPVRVKGREALRKALEPWVPEIDEDGNFAAPANQPEHGVIEIADSGVYQLAIRIQLAEGHTLQLRAAQGTRPVIALTDWQVEAVDAMLVGGDRGSRFVLDGVLVSGRGLQIEGAIASVTIRHATLVPGWSLGPDCDPRRPAEPSILVLDSGVCLTIDHSIVGSIQVNNDEVRTDPIRVVVQDSVVDATGVDCDAPECEALGAAGSRLAFADACFARSTVIGRVMTHSLTAEDSLMLGRVTVARRQKGWLRFCHVAPDSRTPRRFHCQPDLAEAAARADAVARGLGTAEIEARLGWTRAAVRPRFDSLRYGRPEYARLAADCPPEISGGAADGSEMGVFHHLRGSRRLASLKAAIDDNLPAGMTAAVLLAD